MIQSIFVNLPVQDLKRSVEFFTGLGFTFNLKYTDAQGTCMIVGRDIFVMLIEDDKYQEFVGKPVADERSSEVILSLQVDSRTEVDAFCHKAFSLGATENKPPLDMGEVLSWSFEDLDGHIWEAVWIDPASDEPKDREKR